MAEDSPLDLRVDLYEGLQAALVLTALGEGCADPRHRPLTQLGTAERRRHLQLLQLTVLQYENTADCPAMRKHRRTMITRVSPEGQ